MQYKEGALSWHKQKKVFVAGGFYSLTYGCYLFYKYFLII